jgi:hypothetical protein
VTIENGQDNSQIITSSYVGRDKSENKITTVITLERDSNNIKVVSTTETTQGRKNIKTTRTGSGNCVRVSDSNSVCSYSYSEVTDRGQTVITSNTVRTWVNAKSEPSLTLIGSRTQNWSRYGVIKK